MQIHSLGPGEGSILGGKRNVNNELSGYLGRLCSDSDAPEPKNQCHKRNLRIKIWLFFSETLF